MRLPKGGEANSLSQGEEEFGPSRGEVTWLSDVGTKISHLGAVTAGAAMVRGQGAKSYSFEVMAKGPKPRSSGTQRLLPASPSSTAITPRAVVF